RLEAYYIINYYFKYYELLDTVFLALKKKPLAFLHVYHHAATASLCFAQLLGRVTITWVPMTLNLFVHVLMYYYYGMSAAGIKIWWKKHLTTLQIAQFVIDLLVLEFCFYNFLVGKYWSASGIPFLEGFDQCAGDERVAWFACAVLTSYLVLFIQFYMKTYKAGGSKRSRVANAEAVKLVESDIAVKEVKGVAASAAEVGSLAADASPTTKRRATSRRI
ncbi:hypothetical protein HK101_008955, partial [Irineochytrium annulatum]